MNILYYIDNFLKIAYFIISSTLSIGGIHFFLYTKSPKYYFKITRLISKWKDTNWNLVATYVISKEIDFFEVFEETLLQFYDKREIKKPFNLKNKKLYEFGNFTLTAQYNLDVSSTDYVKVELILSNLNVTVKAAEEILKDLRQMFNELEKKLVNIEKSYNLNIKFTQLKNPFFGLMIQRLGEEHVDYFECVFPISLLSKKEIGISKENNYYIRIYKEQITINEEIFDRVEEIAKLCLLMS